MVKLIDNCLPKIFDERDGGDIMDFEKALKELETVVQRLESGGTSLEEGIELFENGIALSKECFKNLGESKKKIESIKIEMDKLLSTNAGDEF